MPNRSRSRQGTRVPRAKDYQSGEDVLYPLFTGSVFHVPHAWLASHPVDCARAHGLGSSRSPYTLTSWGGGFSRSQLVFIRGRAASDRSRTGAFPWSRQSQPSPGLTRLWRPADSGARRQLPPLRVERARRPRVRAQPAPQRSASPRHRGRGRRNRHPRLGWLRCGTAEGRALEPQRPGTRLGALAIRSERRAGLGEGS